MNKFYLCNAIAYVNGKPHMGHVLEYIFADAIRRYHILKGEDVFYQNGTDEHGSKIYKTAKDQGLEIQEMVDKNNQTFVNVCKLLNVEYDVWIRTSSDHHKKGAQKLWSKLDEAGEITEKKKGHLEFKFSSPLKESEFTRFRGQELKKICHDHITPAIAENESKDEEFFAKALVAIQEKILKEPENTTQNISFFFNENLDFSADMFTHEKMGVTLEMATEVVKVIHNELEEKDFKSESILKDKYIAIINTMGLKTGQVMWPARIALTAEEFSPGAYEVAFVLGLEKTQQRLEAALEWLQTNA
jgi:hypothetical protein